MGSQHRINVAMGPKLKAATERAAKRRGLPASALLRTLLVEHLRSVGEITDADLEDDTDPKESE